MVSGDRTLVHVTRGGTTTVEPDDLQAAAVRLRAVAARLDGAGSDLAAASRELAGLPSHPDVAALGTALLGARTAWHAPHRLADELRQLADALVHAAGTYAGAESAVARRVREGLGVAGGLAALSGPLALPLLASTGVAWVLDQVLQDWMHHVLRWAAGGREPVGATIDGLGTVPARMLDAPGTAGAAVYLAGALTAGLPWWVRTGDPVRDAARMAAALLPPSPVTVTAHLGGPPLPAVRGAADAVAAVAQTYGKGPVPLPPATVTVQRHDRADGIVSWVVTVPGTQTAALGGGVPTNSTTNAHLVAGVPDAMTRGVLRAMEAAGVGRDDPVMLVGHSQGGMVAASVAATGAYAVRTVLTAGSPSVPHPVPPGVAHIALVNDKDGVVGADGEPDSARDADIVVVDSSTTASAVFSEHAVHGYVATAAALDAEMATWPADHEGRRALEDVLGTDGDGTVTATTRWTVSTPQEEPPVPPPVLGPPTPWPGPSGDGPFGPTPSTFPPPVTLPPPAVPAGSGVPGLSRGW